MTALRKMRRRAGLTLVELMVYMITGVMILYVTYSFMTGATVLYAKNMSIVHSHTNLRTSLDRLNNSLQQANNRAVLIDLTGDPTVSPTAPGLYYDRYLGDPYVITNPTSTGLPASTATVELTRSTVPLASPPLPSPGDAIIISTPSGSVRGLVLTAVPGTINGGTLRQSITVNLAAPLGSAVGWSPPEIRTATLVRREAFLVVPVGDSSEFRFYPRFEPKPVMSDPARYTVVSSQLSSIAGENTPFSIDTVGTDRLVRASLFSRSTEFSTYLENKQAYHFNTFVRLNTVLSSRLRPQN